MTIDYDVDKLPPVPHVAARIAELLRSPTSSADEIGEVISGDPAISARVLKIANSSFYSMARQVKTLQTAIVILGERTLKTLVLAASLRGMYGTFGEIEHILWADSMICALGSRFLAQKLGVADPEEAFIAGLFRHVGRTVLNNQDPVAYRSLVVEHPRCGSELLALEVETFGINHAELGAVILQHWQFSEAMVAVARYHHGAELCEIAVPETQTLAAIINIASEFPLLLEVFGACREGVDLTELAGAKMLNLEAERLEKLVEGFRVIFEENRDDFLS